MLNGIGYLRISLLPRCNLNCFYCHPHVLHGASEGLNNFGKFRDSLKLLTGLGIKKVRFTGGEPLLYAKLPDLVAFTKSLSKRSETCVTTNGLLLTKVLPVLKRSGLDSVNISLDTLDRRKFREITSSDALDKVLDGIKSAINNVPQVKLNCVVMKGINEHETENLVAYANVLGVDIRFIEYMPSSSRHDQRERYVPGDVIKNRLPYNLTPIIGDPSSAACYYTSPDLKIRVGFINPISNSFCACCNRLRLTARGELYLCLFSGRSMNLFEAIGQGKGRVAEEVRKFVESKKLVRQANVLKKLNDPPSFVRIGG